MLLSEQSGEERALNYWLGAGAGGSEHKGTCGSRLLRAGLTREQGQEVSVSHQAWGRASQLGSQAEAPAGKSGLALAT